MNSPSEIAPITSFDPTRYPGVPTRPIARASCPFA